MTQRKRWELECQARATDLGRELLAAVAKGAPSYAETRQACGRLRPESMERRVRRCAAENFEIQLRCRMEKIWERMCGQTADLVWMGPRRKPVRNEGRGVDQMMALAARAS